MLIGCGGTVAKVADASAAPQAAQGRVTGIAQQSPGAAYTLASRPHASRRPTPSVSVHMCNNWACVFTRPGACIRLNLPSRCMLVQCRVALCAVQLGSFLVVSGRCVFATVSTCSFACVLLDMLHLQIV